jgi:hypothetical protein
MPAGVLVGLSGFEPLTSRLSAVRSNQLSYRPVVLKPEAEARVLRGNESPRVEKEQKRLPEGSRVAP